MTDTNNETISSPSSISSSSSSSNDSIKIKIKRSISKTSTTNRRSQRRRIVTYQFNDSFHLFFFIRMFNHQCEVVH